MRAITKPSLLCPGICPEQWDDKSRYTLPTRQFRIRNALFNATFEMSKHNVPEQQILHTQTFQALSNPGEVFWFGDWWIECIQLERYEKIFPDHRPMWMTRGEWEQFRATIKEYRLAFALEEKPIFMTDDEWSSIVEIKKRHGLLPSPDTNLSMDEVEAKLDLEAQSPVC